MTRLDHVNLAVPRDGTEAVAAFYVELFGLARVPKPPELDPRGSTPPPPRLCTNRHAWEGR